MCPQRGFSQLIRCSQVGQTRSLVGRLISALICAACFSSLCWGSVSNVYVAQNATGSGDGSSCSNAKAASFFNTSGNWGSGSSQIGAGTTVHLCGTWTGGNASNFLQFQGSGSSGNQVTVLFETGAALKPNYCAAAGCIDLNGQSFILIDGGVTCGETSHWATTACNGLIQNQLAGSTGATCPGGACASLSGSTSSSAIGNSSGDPTNVEIRNLHLHLYTRLASDHTDSGNGTAGVGWGGGSLPQHIVMHNMMIDGVMKAYVISLGTGSGTVTDYEVYNSNFSDQCWAMGVGTDAPSMNVTNLQFHDNEVSGWDNWATGNTGNACHTNGTMWFNGDGSTVHSGTGFIGDSASYIHDNYLHGSLTGGYSGSSPSGMLSCQDNCINIAVFNNILHYTNNNNIGGGGEIYFNGAGGGGQLVYNNTMVEDSGTQGSCIVVTGTTDAVTIQNNVASGCGDLIEIRPNCPTCAVSDHNVGYNIVSTWVVNNSASNGSYISLSTWQGTYGQDAHSVTTNPNLSGTFALQSGSSAIGKGTNLTSVNIARLDSDAARVARPSAGPWGAGAYQFSSDSTPAPPSGLQAQVN